MLCKVLERFHDEASGEGDLSPIYAAISTFLDLLNFLTGSGLENYPMKQPGEADSPEEEKNGAVRIEDQTETADTTDAAAASTGLPMMGSNVPSKTEPLRRSIFIKASHLKVIFKLDGQTASESPLTKIEKLIEVIMIENLQTFHLLNLFLRYGQIWEKNMCHQLLGATNIFPYKTFEFIIYIASSCFLS